MAYVVTFPTQHLVLAGVPLSTPAWEVLNLGALLVGPETRGSNVVIPGASGVKARRRRATERTITLEMHIFGFADPQGDPHLDTIAGLRANIETLREVTDPIAINDSLVVAALHWRGVTHSASVQVASLEIGDAAGTSTVAATIDLIIPQGAFS